MITALRFRLLLLAMAAQVVVLLWIYISGLIPLLLGEEVRIRADRAIYDISTFRGYYVRPYYDILSESSVRESASRCDQCINPYSQSDGIRRNELLYVMLSDCDSGLCTNGGVVSAKPQQGLYLRARWDGDGIDLPRINAWFGTKEQAQRIGDLCSGDQDSVIAELRVMRGSGRAAITRLRTVAEDAVYEGIKI